MYQNKYFAIVLNSLVSKKIISGEIDKTILVKKLLNFNLDIIVPILYNNSKEDLFDTIAEKESKLEILKNSI